MPGIISPDSTKPTPFVTPNGHGLLNGHSNGNVNDTGRFASNGFTSSSNQSLNDFSYRSESQSEPHEHGAAEPIAIIGMGCRLPGGSTSSSKLWDLLEAGRSAQGPFPASRFNIDGFYHPNGDRPGSLNTGGGYFIDEDIRSFENGFFGINNLEATFMDPQQRKLLEVVFETFESAGIPLEQLSGANVGCYVGNFVVDHIVTQLKDSEYTHRYTATGLGTTILANRISHVFNLKGPSYVIDTACSSSLYCLHAAVSALRARDCDSAVVAGANLIQSPEQQLATMKAGVLSKTSTCHTFDSSADGYGRADGIGALLVKRLSDAIRDGDPIRSVIRGTAVNSNGRTNGITLPSADGQEAVIRKAYAQAGLGYDETTYVECHGTGTAVGDPIEVEATSRVFKRPYTSPPLLIGSIKTNLGHSEAASGISSIIKVVLALEKGEIPPTVGIRSINPKIKLDEWNIKIVTENLAWPSCSPVKRAGVNSFGYGGANSHVILDAADMHVPSGYMMRLPEETVTAMSRSTMFLPVSATNEAAMKRRLTNLSSLDLPNINTIDLAYTLGVRRSHLPVRGYVLARPGHQEEDLTLENLRTRLQGKTYSRLPLSFVFTGQGAQWPEMGRGLLAEFPIFRRTMQMLDITLQLLPHPPSWTLVGTILESPETSMINNASRSQPICTAIQVGLVNLLSSCGIKPQRVIGHSSGEIAAAYAAGFISAKQAIAIAYYRGYAVTSSSKIVVGAMMAAGLGQIDAIEKIEAFGLADKINVACVNSPESVTISGDVDGIRELKASLDSQGIFARQLKTDGKAYHSHHMAAIGEEYEQYLNLAAAVLGSLTPDPSARSNLDATWISSVNGEIVDQEAIGSSYWRSNLESPVLFDTVVGKLLKDHGPQHLIELGPHSALELPIKQTYTNLNINKDKIHYNAALSRGKDSIQTFLNLVGDLYLHGHTISFKDVNVVGSWSVKSTTRLLPELRQGTMLLDLPKYDWDYDPQQKLWHESRISTEWRNRKYPHHDLLGSVVHGGNGILTSWRNVLKIKDVPWMEGHKLDTTIVVPAAAYLAMAIEAVAQVKGLPNVDPENVAFALQDINITKALVLPQEDGLKTGVEVFTTLQPVHNSKHGHTNWHRFNISSYALDEATTHATGLIQLTRVSELEGATRLPEIKQDDMEPTAPRVWYKQFIEGGLNFQDAFQSLNQVQVHTKRRVKSILAGTELRQSGGSSVGSESKYVIHPITIDALFQAGIIAITRGVVRELAAKVPVHIEQMVLRTPPVSQSAVSAKGTLNVKAIAEPVGFGTIRASGELYDSDGSVLLRIDKCRLVAYESGVQQQAEDERHPMLRVSWKPDITCLSSTNSAQFSSYIKQYVSRSAIDSGSCGVDVSQLMAAVDLLAHKNPRMRVLNFLDKEDEAHLANALRMATDFKRCQSLWRASKAEDGVLHFQDYLSDKKPSVGESNFDLVLYGPDQLEMVLVSFQDVVAPNGALLFAGTSSEESVLEELGFEKPLESQLGGPHEVILARRLPEEIPNTKSSHPIKEEILIVERNLGHSLNSALANQIESLTGWTARRIALNEVTAELLQAHSKVVTTAELDDPLLSNLTEDEMGLVKLLTDNCANLVWVTGGRLLQGSRPEMGIVYGLSRALMLEQPSLRFFVVDVDVEAASSLSDINIAATNILHVLTQAVQASEPDFEFVHATGMLHVSRFLPAEALNSTFREKQGAQKRTLTLAEAQTFHLDTERVGQTDSIFFRQDESTVDAPLVATHVEVSVKAVGLCSMDLQALSGNAESSRDKSCTSQYSGVVTRVGDGVKSLAIGDRVVVMAPGYFATLERVPEDSCCKLKDDEDLKTMASLPVPLSTAAHAINDRARLRASDSVLFHASSHSSDTGAIVAAIRIAKRIGAQIIAVCGSIEEQEQLLQMVNLAANQVFTIDDASLLSKIRCATGDQGVDVVVSFSNDQLDAAIFADYARLVQVGSGASGLSNTVAANSSIIHRDITLTTFDMGNSIARQTPRGRSLQQRLLTDAITLYRSGDLEDLPLAPRVWDIADIASAFRALGPKKDDQEHHTGGVVVSLESDESQIPVMPIKYDTVLSPEKSYLLIGCLGGLGRSMSKWMLSRGARKFVFLGRSGTDKTPARRLVENLQSLGAEVTVIRGDVVNADDVNRAVAGIHGPVGGVIQAAMGLDEALFTTMPRDYWLAGLRPKVTGSWNLYNALSGREKGLDFFLMTSSVSGSVGTATESNYCSANYFLDVFARYLRSVGVPGISVGLGMISEVGYLHENPEIEALLLRKGIQAINEDEMLQIIDIALSTAAVAPKGVDDNYDEMSQGHVLTGLEPLGLKALRAQGFEGSSPVLGDPRAFVISAALDESTDGTGAINSTNGLPTEVAEAIGAGSSVAEAVLTAVSHKFSSLVLIPVDKLDITKPISSVGVDSMLAAEFRTWIFQAFKVDVPYLTLLSAAATLDMLSEMIAQKLAQSE